MYLLKIGFHWIRIGDRRRIEIRHKSVIDKRVPFLHHCAAIHCSCWCVISCLLWHYPAAKRAVDYRNIGTCLSLYRYYSPGRNRQNFQGEVFFACRAQVSEVSPKGRLLHPSRPVAYCMQHCYFPELLIYVGCKSDMCHFHLYHWLMISVYVIIWIHPYICMN